MVQSQNKTVDFTCPATSFRGFPTYGMLLIGDKAVEFYSTRNPKDYIQIPWNEIDHIAASVMFRNKLIVRFVVMTKTSGNFSFSTRNNKATLRAMRAYLAKEQLVRSCTCFEVMKLGLVRLFGFCKAKVIRKKR